MTLRIVKTGTFRTGLFSRAPADVIALDYDWWYSLAEIEDSLGPDEQSMPLAPDGVLYYGRLEDALNPSEPTHPDTFGDITIEAAMRSLELKLGKTIRWQDASAA
jgi:hypothetical protein